MIKVFVDTRFQELQENRHLIDILRAQWNDLPQEDRISKYGCLYTNFKLVSNLGEAHFAVLPLNWNYYLENRRVPQSRLIVEEAQHAQKPILIFSGGDFPANVPFSNVIVFDRPGYRSRRGLQNNSIFATPVFINDFNALYCQGNLIIRNKGSSPVVGFCGQADGNLIDFSQRWFTNRFRWLSYQLKIRQWEPAPFETTIFRKRILDRLQSSPNVETNFIRRKRYRAGYWDKNKDNYHPTRLEYVNNILSTDYTVCMRGGGNFSVRFYETLSLGRIPIFVDTDCILPFDTHFDYRDYCIWIEQSEIPYIAEKVADFHARVSPKMFIEWQHACREFWVNYLTLDGFYRNFAIHFPNISL